MTATHSTRMLILGSGPAGLSAAIYGARAGLAPIVVQGMQPGGQLTITTDVENYPGFKDVIQGPWLMEQMQAQAEHVGAQMMYDQIVDVDLSERPFKLKGDSGTLYVADTLVICTGAQAKWLGVEGEEHLQGKGVSACATCDGFFYRGKKVVVIGGGNTAVEEALYLTNHSHDVTLIHRRDAFQASPSNLARMRSLCERGAMRLLIGQPTGFDSDGGRLTALRVTDPEAQTHAVPLDGLLVFLGLSPRLGPVAGWGLDIERKQLLVDTEKFSTSVPGIFAVGDINTYPGKKKLILSGFHEATLAAFGAAPFVYPDKKVMLQYTTTSTQLHKVLGVSPTSLDR